MLRSTFSPASRFGLLALCLGASGRRVDSRCSTASRSTAGCRRGARPSIASKTARSSAPACPTRATRSCARRRTTATSSWSWTSRSIPKLNSGVQIRSQCFDEPKEVGAARRSPAGRVHGYQVEIDPSDRAWSGGIYDEGRRGWLNDLKDNEAARKAFKQGEWNTFRVECRGDSIKTWINGVPAADLKDDMTPEGFIALQVHGVGAETEPREVRWRNIRIQELRVSKLQQAVGVAAQSRDPTRCYCCGLCSAGFHQASSMLRSCGDALRLVGGQVLGLRADRPPGRTARRLRRARSGRRARSASSGPSIIQRQRRLAAGSFEIVGVVREALRRRSPGGRARPARRAG